MAQTVKPSQNINNQQTLPKGAKAPSYQSAYHGGDKANPLTNLSRILIEKVDKKKAPGGVLDNIQVQDGIPGEKKEITILHRSFKFFKSMGADRFCTCAPFLKSK